MAAALYRHANTATLLVPPHTPTPAAGATDASSAGLVHCSAAVGFGEDTHLGDRESFRDYARVSPAWLDAVITRLEADWELLARLEVVRNDTDIAIGGDTQLLLPADGPRLGLSKDLMYLGPFPVSEHDAVTISHLHAKATKYGDIGDETARALLTRLVRDKFLLTPLRAPGTVIDPLGYLIDQLDHARASQVASVATLVSELREIHTGLRHHTSTRAPGTSSTAGRDDALHVLGDRARALIASPDSTGLNEPGHQSTRPDQQGLWEQSGPAVTVHRRLTGPIQLPASVLADAERAATTLHRLSHRPGDPAWADYHRRFLSRFGRGQLVPVTDLLNPATGLGYPPGYPHSPYPAPATQDEDWVHRRDAALLTLAITTSRATHPEGSDPAADELAVGTDATSTGLAGAVMLDDASLDAMLATATTNSVGLVNAPAHLDLAVTIHAPTVEALNAGYYLLRPQAVAPAGTWTAACALDALDDDIAATTREGTDEYTEFIELVRDPVTRALRDAPPDTLDATRIQLTYSATDHNGPGGLVPTCLPIVARLGAYPAWSTRDQVEAKVEPLAAICVFATADRLYLAAPDGEVLDPHLFGDRSGAPPLARFLADLNTGFTRQLAAPIDWGPVADQLPHLPRIQYGRIVLSPARWRITDHDLHTSVTGSTFGSVSGSGADGVEALAAFRQRWTCPPIVDLVLRHPSDWPGEPTGSGEGSRGGLVPTVRLNLADPHTAGLLVQHITTHGQAILTETLTHPHTTPHMTPGTTDGTTENTDAGSDGETDGDVGWLGAADLVIPLVRRAAPAPSPTLPSDPPVTRPPKDGQLPGSGNDGETWTAVKIFTAPETMTTLITRHLPVLHAANAGIRVWYERHPATSLDPAHLRIHAQIHDTDNPSDGTEDGAEDGVDGGAEDGVDGGGVVMDDVLTEIARWTERLVDADLTARVDHVTYFPEEGIYGAPVLIEDAETVHVTDSALCIALLTEWSRPTPNPLPSPAPDSSLDGTDPATERAALAAASVVHIARAYLGYDDLAYRWLATPDPVSGRAHPQPQPPPESNRDLLARTVELATADLYAPDPALPAVVRQRWDERTAALTRYSRYSPRDIRDGALSALLAAHTSRLHSDTAHADACLNLARLAAHTVLNDAGLGS